MSCSNTSSSSRRVFIARVVAGGTAIITIGAQAQAAPMVDEKDAQASALGYVADTTKADTKKIPEARQRPEVQQLPALHRQGRRQGRPVLAVCGQAGRGRRLVQCLGEEARLMAHPRSGFAASPSRGQREWPGKARSTAFAR